MNVTMGYYNDPQQQQQNQMMQQGLSTAGTIGGAALGSAVPVVGTALGGAIGGALGGVVGGLLGGHKKKKAQTKIFIPNWTGVPGAGGPENLGPVGNPSSPSSGMSALSGGLGGLQNAMSIGNQFGGDAGSGSGSPLTSMFGMGQQNMPFDHPEPFGAQQSSGDMFNSRYFNSMHPTF